MVSLSPPEFALETGATYLTLQVTGDWTVATVHLIDSELRELSEQGPVVLDVSGLGKLDTAGAFVIDRTLRQISDEEPRLAGEHPVISNLLAQIHPLTEPVVLPRRRDAGFLDLLERTGRGFEQVMNESIETLAFLGQTVVTIIRMLLNPWKLRWTSIVSVMEEAGVDAIPIIAFLTFFVGMVVAFIGATTLRDFDLEIYTVELIGFSMLREFGVVLTGIVLAGRTNSSFTAQIGTMKMRQEIDAMQTLGLQPMEVLVAPRVIAMVLMTPILAFVATVAGVAGGALIGWLSLDVNPGVFFERMRNSVPLDQFWIGMSKAPVFGFVVALIACRQGLQVGGSVQSLGARTTTSVVQAIFSVIVIDALFAIFYMELGI